MNRQQRLLFNTQCGLYFSALLVLSRLVLGVMGNLQLIGTALYTASILLAKRQCVVGWKKGSDFAKENVVVFVFLFSSSLLYTSFVVLTFLFGRSAEGNFIQAVLTALISFTELVLSLISLFRLTDDHYCFNIKVINVCIAFIALRSTQIALLDYTATTNSELPNMLFGIGVGVAVMICSIALLLRPKFSVMGREYNQFKLSEHNGNNFSEQNIEVVIVKSKVYGSYVYKAQVNDGIARGNIVRNPSLWKSMHVTLKILCIVLSEILVFAWLVGRLVFMFRTINLHSKLVNLMSAVGFTKID